MRNRLFGSDRRRSPARKVMLVAVMTVGLLLGWGVAALSGNGPPWIFTVDGVMMPDNRQPTPAPAGNNQKATHSAATAYSYKGTRPTYTFYRNGQPWVTVTMSGGATIVTDPNDGQQVLQHPAAATPQRKTLTTSPTH